MLGDGDISFFFFSFFFKWMYLHMFENQLQVLTHLTHVCTQVCTSPMGTLTVDVMGFSSGEWVVILLEIHLSKCNLDKNLQLFCRPKVHYSGVKWSLVSAQTGFLSNRDVEWEHKLFRELKGAASSSLHGSSEEHLLLEFISDTVWDVSGEVFHIGYWFRNDNENYKWMFGLDVRDVLQR